MDTLKHVRKTILSNEKAFSSIITTMLFLSLAVTAGILCYSWAMASWSNSVGGVDQWTQRRADNMKENLVIESVWFNRTTGIANLTVRNVGVTPTTVSSVYVDGVLVLSPNKSIKVGQAAFFTMSVAKETHTFKIVTLKGSSASVVWAPT